MFKHSELKLIFVYIDRSKKKSYSEQLAPGKGKNALNIKSLALKIR